MVDSTSNKNPCQSPSITGMGKEVQETSSRRKYVQVDYDKRKELLHIIDEENLTIKSAAEKLSINYSNAKNIVKLYKKEHRIEKLPKKPSLTIREITSAPLLRDSAVYKDALLPFYDPVEALQFLGKGKNCSNRGPTLNNQANNGKPIVHSDDNPIVTRITGTGRTSNQYSGNSPASNENSERTTSIGQFNFLAYTPLVLGRYSCFDLNFFSFFRRLAEISGERSYDIDFSERTLPCPFIMKHPNN